jgi:hypothetical protein
MTLTLNMAEQIYFVRVILPVTMIPKSILSNLSIPHMEQLGYIYNYSYDLFFHEHIHHIFYFKYSLVIENICSSSLILNK